MIIIFLILSAVIVSADPIRGRIVVESTHLENKIINGWPSYQGEYKYMASLQLNGSHICSSSMFREGFLLTTGDCAYRIARGMKKERHRATAVLANLNLNHGPRIHISKIAYYSSYHRHESEVGVIMLANNIDYTHAQVLNLYTQRINLHVYGTDASVCGWSLQDNPALTALTIVEHLDNLHCMTLNLYGEKPCYKAIHFGDYKRKLLCGKGNDQSNQGTTLGDIGSPLTKIFAETGEDTKYIIGVTVRRFKGENDTFLRFIRINAVSKDIEELVEELESERVKD